MEEFMNRINEVEMIKSSKYYTEFVNGFESIKEWAEIEELSEEAKLAQYEIDICSLVEKNPILSKNKAEHRFVPKYTFSNGMNIPEVDKFTDDQFEYYEKRLDETENIFLKVRYADFLFEYSERKMTMNKYQISQYLLAGLVDICKHYQHENYDCSFVYSISRLVEISLLMNNKEYIQQAIQLIYSQLIAWQEKNDLVWNCSLSQLFREILNTKFRNLISKEQLDSVLGILQIIRDKCFENKDYHLFRMFTGELIKYRYFNFYTAEQVCEFELDIGRSFELDAEYQGGRKQKSLYIKADYLEQALTCYKEIGKSEKIQEMKILIKQTYEEYTRSDEMSTISVPLSVPKDIIDKCVDFYATSDIQDSLDKIACTNRFIPNVEVIKQQISQEDYLFLRLVSKSIIHNGNKTVNTKTEEDSDEFSFIRSFCQELMLNIEIFLKNIFDKMIDDYHLSTNDILEKLNRWGNIDERNYSLIEIGLSRFFDKDYVSSIHILIPQFESVLRTFFAKLGFSTTSLKKNMTQNETTFNEFLKRKDIKDVLGNDIHSLIQIVMVEQSGLNLRNEVAHGLINLSEITKSKCILVIYLFLILTRFTNDN